MQIIQVTHMHVMYYKTRGSVFTIYYGNNNDIKHVKHSIKNKAFGVDPSWYTDTHGYMHYKIVLIHIPWIFDSAHLKM